MKLKGKYLLVMVLLLFTSSVLISGCAEKVAEKTTEKIMEEASGGEVDVNVDGDSVTMKSKDGNATWTVGDTYEWPESMPADVPEYKDAAINGLTEVDTPTKSWMVMLTEVPENAGATYKEMLEDDGWNISAYSTMDGTVSIYADKAPLQLWAVFGSTDHSGSITVTEEGE